MPRRCFTAFSNLEYLHTQHLAFNREWLELGCVMPDNLEGSLLCHLQTNPSSL